MVVSVSLSPHCTPRFHAEVLRSACVCTCLRVAARSSELVDSAHHACMNFDLAFDIPSTRNEETGRHFKVLVRRITAYSRSVALQTKQDNNIEVASISANSANM